jgi:hypothetical protein
MSEDAAHNPTTGPQSASLVCVKKMRARGFVSVTEDTASAVT